MQHKIMTALTAAIVSGAAGFALEAAARLEPITLAAVAGAMAGVLAMLPVVAVLGFVAGRAARARPSEITHLPAVVSPITGARLALREGAQPVEIGVPILRSARDHRMPPLEDDGEPEPAAEVATVVLASTYTDPAGERRTVRARREDVIQLCRMWPANPRRSAGEWRGTAAHYGAACQFLAAHRLLHRAGKSWQWAPHVRRGHDLAQWLEGITP